MSTTFTIGEITFTAVRKATPIPHWLCRIEETGEVLESGAAGISNKSIPKMQESITELFVRVSKRDVKDHRRRFGLPENPPEQTRSL